MVERLGEYERSCTVNIASTQSPVQMHHAKGRISKSGIESIRNIISALHISVVEMRAITLGLQAFQGRFMGE